MYKVAIVGSRKFCDYKLMKEILDPVRDKIAMIISGGAIGADTLAQQYAKDNGLTILIYYPEWKKYRKKAGFIRNVKIANVAERMIAFAYPDSRGTRHVVRKMKDLNKPACVVELQHENLGDK